MALDLRMSRIKNNALRKYTIDELDEITENVVISIQDAIFEAIKAKEHRLFEAAGEGIYIQEKHSENEYKFKITIAGFNKFFAVKNELQLEGVARDIAVKIALVIRKDIIKTVNIETSDEYSKRILMKGQADWMFNHAGR